MLVGEIETLADLEMEDEREEERDTDGEFESVTISGVFVRVKRALREPDLKVEGEVVREGDGVGLNEREEEIEKRGEIEVV